MKLLLPVILLLFSLTILSTQCFEDDDVLPPPELLTPEQLTAFLSDTTWNLDSIHDNIDGNDLTGNYKDLIMEFEENGLAR